MKYNNMVEMNQEKSRQKVQQAMKEIQHMRSEGEKITISKLSKRTGLSDSFFYTNEKVRKAVHKAIDLQDQSYKMNIEGVELVDRYKEKLLDMRIEIVKLKSENQKLRLEIDALKVGQRKEEPENNEI